jgi:hypothetical protein
VDETTQALLRSLNNQRDHVTAILDGLAADALHRPILPTGWSCLGLVQHLTFDVERFWFRQVTAGEVIGPDEFEASAALAWSVEPSTPPDVVLARYRAEIEHADTIIASTPLDRAPVAWPDDLFGDFRLADLRAVLLHVITETACHAGHLDAVCELIDGRTWLTL